MAIQIQKNTLVNYDSENDILYIHKKVANFKRNLDLEEIILDIDKENKVTGIEIRHASKYYKPLGIAKQHLKNIIGAAIQSKYYRDGKVMVYWLFLSKVKEVESPVPSSVMVPISVK